MHGRKGSTFTYAWKVFLPSDFVTIGKFCHIHQIKLTGRNVGFPNITLTARNTTVELINEGNILSSCQLQDFVGQWIQIR